MMTGIAYRIPGYTMLAYMNRRFRRSLVNACEDLKTLANATISLEGPTSISAISSSENSGEEVLYTAGGTAGRQQLASVHP